MSIQYKNSDILSVPNVSSLFTLKNLNDNQLVQTQGYSAEGVGANFYRYDAGSSATIDGGFVLPGPGGTLSFSGTTFNGDAGDGGRFIAVDQSRIRATHFGAVLAVGTDNSNALQRAIKVAEDMVVSSSTWSGFVEIDMVFIRLNAGVTVSQNGVKIKGQGTYNTAVRYGGTGTLFEFVKSAGASSIYHSGIEGMSITADDTSSTKIGIKFTSASEFYCKDITFPNWIGGDSTALRCEGHESFTCSNFEAHATVPIRLSKSLASASIGIDHFHFSDLYLIRTGSAPATLENANLLIDDGTYVANLTIDGRSALVSGKHGVYYNTATTTPAAESHGVRITGMRFEQNNVSGGYAIYWEGKSTSYTQFIDIENVRSSSGIVYLRKCRTAKLSSLGSGSSIANAIDFDSIGHLFMESSYSINSSGINGNSMKMLCGSSISTGFDGNGSFSTAIWTTPNTVSANGFYTTLELEPYADADTTPSVKNANLIVIANGSSCSITDFDDAAAYQPLTVRLSDANTTIVHNASLISTTSGSNITGPGTFEFVSINGVWYQK